MLKYLQINCIHSEKEILAISKILKLNWEQLTISSISSDLKGVSRESSGSQHIWIIYAANPLFRHSDEFRGIIGYNFVSPWKASRRCLLACNIKELTLGNLVCLFWSVRTDLKSKNIWIISWLLRYLRNGYITSWLILKRSSLELTWNSVDWLIC